MKNHLSKNLDLKGKKVLLRLDLNVPLKDGVVTDETRINKIVPVINFLIKKKSKIIIISHIGRPRGEINKKLSLKPICEDLKVKLSENIRLIDENIFKIAKSNIFKENEKIVLNPLRYKKVFDVTLKSYFPIFHFKA